MDGIDMLRLHNGSVNYVHRSGTEPSTIRTLNVELHNVRAARSGSVDPPSTLMVEAVVFDDGRLRVDGAADLWREPHAAFKGRIEVGRIALRYLEPLLSRHGLSLARGAVEAAGRVEYSSDATVLDLEYVNVNGLLRHYVYRGPLSRW